LNLDTNSGVTNHVVCDFTECCLHQDALVAGRTGSFYEFAFDDEAGSWRDSPSAIHPDWEVCIHHVVISDGYSEGGVRTDPSPVHAIRIWICLRSIGADVETIYSHTA